MNKMRQNVWAFLLGFLSGLCVLIIYNIISDPGCKPKRNFNPDGFFSEKSVEYFPTPNDDLIKKENEKSTRADPLRDQVSVLCWVTTSARTHGKAHHLMATWGKRCNKVLFFSDKEDSSLGTVTFPTNDTGRKTLWGRTKLAVSHLCRNYADYSWFLKADDDTYVVMENLRSMLSAYDPAKLLYFGYGINLGWTLKWHNTVLPVIRQMEYFSGGAGYVLSRPALRKLCREIDLDNSTSKCKGGTIGDEDKELGECLKEIGTTFVDSRDSSGRERFHPLPPEFHLIPGTIESSKWDWAQRFSMHPISEGPDCCSRQAISFHYIQPEMMHVLEYLIYDLQVGQEEKL